MAAGIPLRRGFYAQERDVLTKEIFGNTSRMAVWQYLQSQAGYASGHWRDRERIILLKKGDVVFSVRTASKVCGIARETFNRVLADLVRRGLIAVEKLKTGTLVRLTRKIRDAVIRPRGLMEAHKEIKDSKRSYKSQPSSIAGVLPASQNVSGVRETRAYLDSMSAFVPARAIPDESKRFLDRLLGRA